MDRYWFFTWRTYGTWLPGQPGFVGFYRSHDGVKLKENIPGTPTADPMPALARYSATIMTQEPVALMAGQAGRILEQLHETARYRGRQIDALAVMVNHFHLVFGTVGDPDPDKMLDDWKAYCSRALNRLVRWAPPDPRPVWWERGGSKRKCSTPLARAAAIRYVRDQDNPLVVWLSSEAEQFLAEYPAGAGGCVFEDLTPGRSVPQ
jgi:REP element-mobilizing transposase RayT